MMKYERIFAQLPHEHVKFIFGILSIFDIFFTGLLVTEALAFKAFSSTMQG